ncbi:MAG TPA: endonuclease domain-containing protein [Polyangiaceae bacterium]|nr:endonuclease domain-containing protein [Polyangiaceae bacterium]
MHSPNSPSLFAIVRLARQHRKAPTPSEAALWRRLCHSQLGVRVRRQHPLHPYIADFYVASHRLVIEVDGAVHASAEARACDARRSAELERLHGVRVMRLPAGLVERDVEAAVALVRAALR